jgi:hypothetical protein
VLFASSPFSLEPPLVTRGKFATTIHKKVMMLIANLGKISDYVIAEVQFFFFLLLKID